MADTLTPPREGDYGLTQIGGILGFLVGFGMLLLGDSSRFTHAFVIVNVEHGIAIEARPFGARLVYYREEYADRLIAYSHIDLTDTQRAGIVRAAYQCLGRGYNYLDYLSLALTHYGIAPRWVRRHAARTDRLVCSQLVDVVYRLEGVHLFDDGRASGDVTPGDLSYIGNVY